MDSRHSLALFKRIPLLRNNPTVAYVVAIRRGAAEGCTLFRVPILRLGIGLLDLKRATLTVGAATASLLSRKELRALVCPTYGPWQRRAGKRVVRSARTLDAAYTLLQLSSVSPVIIARRTRPATFVD